MAFEIFADNLPENFKSKNIKNYKKYKLMPIKRDFYWCKQCYSFELENK